MRRIKTFFIILMFLYPCSIVQAGEVKYALKGNKELNLIGSVAFYSWNTDGNKYVDGTSILIGLNFGYFVVDKL